MARHLIYKQKVTLHIPKKEAALAYQQRVSDLLQNQLKDSIENVFDQAFPSDEIIRIDSLKIDLGTLSAHNFEQEFKSQFISQLEKSLGTAKTEFTKDTGKQNGEVLTNARSLISALMFFLEKGYLPWYRTVQDKAEWETEIENSLSESEYKLFIDWLRDNYEESQVIIRRLVLQFSDAFLEDLLLRIARAFDDPWKLIYNDFTFLLNSQTTGATREARRSSVDGPPGTKYSDAVTADSGGVHEESGDETSDDDAAGTVGEATISESLIREKIWHYAFLVLLSKKGGDAGFDILDMLIRHFGVTETITTQKETKILQGLKTHTARLAFKKLVSILKTQQQNPESHVPKPEEDISAQSTEMSGDKNIIDEVINPAASEKKHKPAETKNRKKNLVIEKEVIYTNNSGIVIIHPYLRAYFESLGLCIEKKFINDTARQRAVLLLHYLATGSTEAAEFDLAIEKILCGYPREETLPASIRLSKKEKEESKSLLLSVISHWPPLKTTSITGLRETFFQRSGKLESKENGWLLTVEQKTLDILLGKLPWGFSTIRLPWMADMLNVDWY
jgi:hypothetical protein